MKQAVAAVFIAVSVFTAPVPVPDFHAQPVTSQAFHFDKVKQA